MSPIRIALDGSLLFSGNTGDSRYWEGLVYGLGKLHANAEFFVITPDDRPIRLPDGFHRVVCKSSSRRLFSLFRLPLAARKLGAHILHSQYFLSPLARGGVSTIHDVSFFVDPTWFSARDRTLLQWGARATARHARGIITVSETSKKEIEHYLPRARGKVHVTYNALSPGFSPPERVAAENIVREKFGLNSAFALTVGTRWPRKNMNLAVKALLQSNTDLNLVISGKAGWGHEIYNDRIKRVGWVSEEDLMALYASADVYLAPSLHEGFGIPLLEAWAAKTPVICGPGGAFPEVAGDAAIVAPDYEVTTWSRLINELVLTPDLKEGWVERGTKRLQAFSWEDSASKSWEVYQSCCCR